MESNLYHLIILFIHYDGPANLYLMVIFILFSDEKMLMCVSYSVVDRASLTTGSNHSSYEVVEGMDPLEGRENHKTYKNSHIKIIQFGLVRSC